MTVVTPHTVDQIAAEFADREAIRDCFARHARGFDQGEPELVHSAYWPDAKHKVRWKARPKI